MPNVRVHNFAMSLDGYAAGPDQSVDDPLGAGGTRLHEWVFATRSGRRMIGQEGGEKGIDDDFVARGDDPPYHHPDVRVGGGVSTIQQCIRAGLIDDLHVVIVPILLGRGERLFENLDDAPGYECVQFVASPSVAHVRLART